MAPKRGGGGSKSFGGGGGGGSSVDPTTLAEIFHYVLLALFALFYFCTIVAIFKKKQHFPYIFLHSFVALMTLGYLLAVLGIAVGNSLLFVPAVLFIHLGYFLAWLLTFEPSRHIMNLQSSNPAFERTSIFNIKQYTHGGTVGYTLLFSYIYAFVYLICAVAFAGISTTDIYTIELIPFKDFIFLAVWAYVPVWIYLTSIHRKLIIHVKSYYFYGFFIFCSLIGRTLLRGMFAFYVTFVAILEFVLINLTVIFAIYTCLRYGAKWVSITKDEIASTH